MKTPEPEEFSLLCEQNPEVQDIGYLNALILSTLRDKFSVSGYGDFVLALGWIEKLTPGPIDDANPRNSYELKEEMSRELGVHVSHGAVILALLHRGFPTLRVPRSHLCYVGIA